MVQSLGWESLQHRRYTDRLCYLQSSMVWLTSLPTTFNPMTPVREVPNACGSYKLLKTSTSTLFTPVLSVTGINCLPLFPMSRHSRNLGKASQVCLPNSCNPTRLSHLYIVLTGDLGCFTCFYRASQFLHRVTYNPRRLLPLKWKKKKKKTYLLEIDLRLEQFCF